MTPRRTPTLTPLHLAYLEALYDGKKTGKEMRATLSRRGVRNNPIAFYRTIRWLKDAALITSSRCVTQPFGYLGPVLVYELTKAGRHSASITRATKLSNNNPIKEAF